MAKARERRPLKGASKPPEAKASKPTALRASKVAAVKVSKAPIATKPPADGKTVIPVAAEFLEIGKRLIETGRGVRVSKIVRENEHVVDEGLNQDELHVERVPINRFIEASEVPSIRQEEDVTVVPILEEVLVTEKRLFLKEEVRITRVRRQVRQPQRVVLRTEQVSVEHFDETGASMKAGAGS